MAVGVHWELTLQEYAQRASSQTKPRRGEEGERGGREGRGEGDGKEMRRGGGGAGQREASVTTSMK